MIVMEGMLLAPPDRGTIIGRALWKPRYVVLGTGSTLKTQNDLMSQTEISSKKKGLKPSSSKPNLVDVSQPESKSRELFISIYKAKGDWEFLAQHPVSAFKSCVVKDVAHRKQSPALPTLVLELKPDTLSDKQRKRRSSRTGVLTKDQWTNIFLFRTIPDEKYSIIAWQAMLEPLLTFDDHEEESIMSPMSPTFNFTNPFASRTTSSNRPNQQQSPYSQAPPPRPSALISPSPSLRSRRSDLSSQASSQHPPMGFASHSQAYPPTLPTDLPSPASTSGYDTQFIEGWTSAQGRSSALSSHTRGSNSIASAIAPIAPNASTPPGPRETILDRAFQMRCIPGSERLNEKEEENGKLSSIARFEALMREHDARKATQSEKQKQSWGGLEEESEDSDQGEPVDDDEDDLEMSDQDPDISIPTPAQRALDYIAGRKTPLGPSSSNNRPLAPPPHSPPIPFLNSQAMAAFHGHTGLRPRTGTTSSRKGGSRPASMALPSRSISTSTIPSLKELTGRNEGSNLKNMDVNEKRSSSTSVKRLSFQEFAKRLSSTSSLLLVQTNQSSSSGRGSSEYGDLGGQDERSSVGIRGGAGSSLEQSQRDKRCGWRGSVGAFGVEGGFL